METQKGHKQIKKYKWTRKAQT